MDGISEVNWVSRTRRRLLEEDLEEDDGIHISIVTVPKTFSSTRIEAYRPQLVSIGPYHWLQPDLRDMESFKLSAAKKVQTRIFLRRRLKFEDVVTDFLKYELVIRAHYNRYLDLNSDTLAWMMAVDASFLFELLRIHATEEDPATEDWRRGKEEEKKKNNNNKRSPSSSVHDSVLRDVLVIENQIPLFSLTKIVEHQCSSKLEAENTLLRIVIRLLEDVSPFQIRIEEINLQVSIVNHPHLLDLTYNLILMSAFQSCCCIRVNEEQQGANDDDDDEEEEVEEMASGSITLEMDESSNEEKRWRRQLVKLGKLCFKLILNLSPIFLVFRHLRFWEEDSHKAPAVERPVEEVDIPSVTQLVSAGVKFRPATAFDFDPSTSDFHLPVITLDATTTVVHRNLLVYEVSVVDGPSVLTRFTEVMVGIIDEEEDVKVLRESGVLVSYLRSDGEVVEFWNEMGMVVNGGGRRRRRRNDSSRSSKRRRRKVYGLFDRIVEDLNKRYNGRIGVRLWRLLKKKINEWFWSWELGIRLLFAVLLLFFVSLHGVCFFLRCGH